MRCKKGTRKNKSGKCVPYVKSTKTRAAKCPRGSRKKVKGGPCIPHNHPLQIVSKTPFIQQYETKFERF